MSLKTESYLQYNTYIRSHETKQITTFDPKTNRFSNIIIEGRDVRGIITTEYGKINTDYRTTHKITVKYKERKIIDVDSNTSFKVTGNI